METCSPDNVVNLHCHPLHRTGIHMDLVFGEVSGLGCWSLRSSSGFIAGVDPRRDYVLLHWIRSGSVVFNASRQETAFSADSVFVWQSAALNRVEHTPDLDLIVTTIRQNDIKAFVRTLTGVDHDGPIEVFAIPPDSRQESGLRFVMATLAGAVLDDTPLSGAPLAVAALKDMVLGALVELCPSNIRLRRFVGSSEPMAVARAQEFMRANLSRPIRVAEIAEASQVSLRTLQAAFRRTIGQSLVEHLRMLRLERARIDLSDPFCSPRVSEIGYRWGFPNPSDFARRYHQTFGEHPSDTRRRQRR